MENRRGKDLNPDEEARDILFHSNRERLEQLAWRAIQRGLSPSQFITVLIDVDDPAWKEVVDNLMPGQNWQQYRDQGQKPLARGTVTGDFVSILSKVVPAIAPALDPNRMPSGLVKAVIMGNGGASVYVIEPTPQYRNN